MSKTNIFFSRFEGTSGEKYQIFRTLEITEKNELVTFLYQELKNIEEQLEEKKSIIKNLSNENEVKNDKIVSISQELMLCKARAVEALKANKQKLIMYQEEISDKNKMIVLKNHEIAEKDLEIAEKNKLGSVYLIFEVF